DGKRYDDDMITVAGNAGCSKAMRNAILKVVPRAYIEKVYNKAKEVAIGKAISLDAQRMQAFEYIKKMGIPEDRILAAINRPSIKDVSVDDIVALRGLATSIKDGELTIEEAFPELDSKDDDVKPKATTSKGAAARTKEKLGIKPEPAPTPKIPARTSDEWSEQYFSLPEDKQKEYEAAFKRGMEDGLSESDSHEAAFGLVTANA